MPDDPTPHGGEVLHPRPDRAKIPQPKPKGDDPEPRVQPPAKMNPEAPQPSEAPPSTPEPKPKAPPAEDERGPQAPVELPGRSGPPERV
ncbi:MAG TPA: hypothetical protein VHA82_10655 [Ramlibacter sp.]|uniref:hypothetical protein n=1 Tax=Ramlibacter sp. TaxID=1917967 RepID=UPI002C25E7D0|nr:hypothetical protein [Ramlibacter sp.]HVZ44258.1 hypothetical protein [Ramlibacter sp.]